MHSPIETQNPDGSKKTILPFGRPFIDAEADYRAANPLPVPVAVPVKPIIAEPVSNQAAPQPMSLREAFYSVYIEPVVLAAKMGTVECKKLFHRDLH